MTLWVVLACMSCCGCTAIFSPLSGVPARRLPKEFLPERQANKVSIDFARLRQPAPPEYLLDAEDVLGIYIEGVLGTSDEPPPVQFPEIGSDLPPSIGFPMPVREDGTVSLPLLEPILVRGLTLRQAEQQIRSAYIAADILKPGSGSDRTIVTLVRERTYKVIVIREDGGPAGGFATQGVQLSRTTAIRGATRQAFGYVLNLPAYKNDVLNALAETGGLPGLDAKNEVKILRSSLADTAKRDAFVQEFYAAHDTPDPCDCPPPLPDDPSTIRIPLRLPPGQVPTFLPQDVILDEGDIVYVESRDTEVFYTGGLLPGGEFQLPRDYDLDVLGAMAIAGQGVGSLSQRGGQFGGFSAVVPPTQLYVLRRTPCDGQVVISVDLNRAITSPSERLLVQAGDTLILRYKPIEETANFGIMTFFTYGIRYLFRN